MSTVSFSGVGSGNDWSTLISALVASEKVPATALTTRKTNAATQSSLVGGLVTSLRAMAAQAQKYTISSSSIWANATTSSDPTRITATSTGTAAVGSYSLKVNALAQGETRLGKNFDTAAAGAAGTGSISIGVGSGTQTKVDYTASDSLADIAARINSSVSGVTAAAVYDGSKYQLTMTSTATGKVNTLNVTETGSGLGLAASGSIVQAADDASLTLNGVTVKNASNHISDLVSGVTLDLQSTTPAGGSATLISVGRDAAAVTTKIKSLIDAYNGAATLIHNQTTFDGTVKGQDTLFGDPIISGLQRELGGAVAQAFTHGTGQVSGRDLGITLNADGTLALNEDTLKGKIAGDPKAVEDLLTGPNGLAKALTTLSDKYTMSTGPLLLRQLSLADAMKSYDKQITEINTRATQLETRLKSQFAALDALMAQYNTSSTALTSFSNSSSG